MGHATGSGRPMLGVAAVVVAGSLMTLWAPPAMAQDGPSQAELAQANNPLASASALNLQDYYVPSLSGVPDATANTFWLRVAYPMGRTITRASLPLATRPTGGAPESGLGDFNIFTAYLMVANPTTSIGIGPLLVAPTATEDALGAGKWQAGAAAVAFKAYREIQIGGLVTWQASFAGDASRPSTSALAIQPFSIWQLGGGTYLRSTGIWVFDLKSGGYNVPFGLGIGKVIKAGHVVYNIFLEPQFTILQSGVGQPNLQIFTGLNLQFPR